MRARHETPIYPHVIPYPTPSPSTASSSTESGPTKRLPKLTDLQQSAVDQTQPLMKKAKKSMNTSTEFKESLKSAKSANELRDKYFEYWEREQKKVSHHVRHVEIDQRDWNCFTHIKELIYYCSTTISWL